MEPYKILSVQDSDLPMCLETIKSAFAVNAEKYGFTEKNYPSCGAFMTMDDLISAKKRNVHMYAAWVGNKIVGYVQLEKTEPSIYHFQRFAVLPQYQNLGIGKALISFCQNKATIYGGKKINLIVVYENEKLRKFYESNGFRLITTKTDPQHPFVYGVMEMNLK